LFRQLRLNQWVKQSVRWMPMEKWDKCAFPVDPDSLIGRECYAGLDLASTTDITAVVLVFPPEYEDDKYVVLPYFWIPEENITQRVSRDRDRHDDSGKQGRIQTTDGQVVDHADVETVSGGLRDKDNIKDIAFDQVHAVQLRHERAGLGVPVAGVRPGLKI